MATILTGTRDQIKIVYKTEYDTNDEFPNLESWSATLSYVREDATLDEKKAYADVLAGLTQYFDAPYIVQQVETGRLAVG